jgi:hypothetical protein
LGQCRACGAGHILAILGRAVDEHRMRAVDLFGEQVIPILHRADITWQKRRGTPQMRSAPVPAFSRSSRGIENVDGSARPERAASE